MSSFDYDLVVVGSGPAGYVSAIRARQLGVEKVAVLEKEKVGGVCLNIGCIPSKALIHQASLFSEIHGLEEMGISVNTSKFDFKKVFQKSRTAADTLSKGVNHLLKKNKIDLIQGEFKFTKLHELTSKEGKSVTGKHIIIATGSRPRVIPGFSVDGKHILTSNESLLLETLPKRALVLGSGAIGMEFAYVWNAFGVDVTVVEMLPNILPIEDEETASVVRKAFEKNGVKFYTDTKALSSKIVKDNVEVELQAKDGKKETHKFDVVLVAVGRVPNTEKLGLDMVGIRTDSRGFIEVKEYGQTSTAPHIYAIGDVVSTPLLAHVGSKEGEIAAEHIAGHKTDTGIDPLSIPSATYCEPEIASFGYPEWKAKAEGVKYKKATFPYRGAGKSVAIGKSDGLVKILTNPDTHEIIGAHVVGVQATELIHELLLARKAELLPEDIATMIHAHPTISEAVMEGSRASEGWAIHF